MLLGMRKSHGVLALALLLVSCASTGESESSTPAPEAEVAEVESVEPEASQKREITEQDRAACLTAWEAEFKAVQEGSIDDATLRATGTACPSLAVWEEMRDEVGYGSKSPNLVRAICALEKDARICEDN
jgi:hypothetical protein